MSSGIRLKVGNDTIHHYPLPCEGKLSKVLCVSREIFKKLKAALNEFDLGLKPASPKPKTPLQQKVSKKEPLENPKNNDLKPDNNYTGSYEPSNILNTRFSSFWRAQNLKAWFKEQASYEDPRYLKSYLIKI